MKPIGQITSTVVAVMDDNIDTDQLVPKQAIKDTARKNYGDVLFSNRRYLEDGRLNPEFVLNDFKHEGAQILITGHNFGYGSSWEHAVWALRDYGFQAVIAKDFNDIFYMNCINNGVLPVKLADEQCDQLASLPADQPVTIDLSQQTVTFAGQTAQFEINAFWKDRLVKGIDDIEATETFDSAIKKFEQRRVEE